MLFVLVFMTSVYEAIPLLFVMVVYVVLGVWVSDSRVLVLVNSYLFVGVLSNVVLLRYKLLHTGYYVYSLFLYVLFVFLSGVVWLLSVSSIIGVLRIDFSVSRFILKCLWVAGLIVGVFLFVYSTLHYLFEPYMLLLVSLPALVIVFILLFFERVFFHRVLVFAKSSRGHDPDKLIYSFFVFLFVFAVLVFTVLFPELRPGDRIYLALSVSFLYYYSSLVLGLMASLFIVHGMVLDHVRIGGSAYSDYLVDAVSEYFRMRYVSSLVRVFNYLEALGGKGRGFMSRNLCDVLLDSYRRWSSVLRGVGVFKRVGEFVNEINSISIIRLRSDLYSVFRDIDESGGLAKTVESLTLKLYREAIRGGDVSRILKQLRGEVRVAVKKCRSTNSIDCSVLKELCNSLKNIDDISSFLDKLIEKEPLRLRDLRNFLVHGKLTREYVLVEDRVHTSLPFINEPIKLYILASLLLLSITSQSE